MELLYKRFHENVLDSFGFRVGAGLQASQVPGSGVSRQDIAPPSKKIEENYQSNNLKPQVIQGKRTPTQSV